MSEITDATVTPLETLTQPAAGQPEQAPKVESPKSETAPETVSKTQEEPKTESVFGMTVTKDEEGNFVWKSPTSSTTYKCKTEAELFENMSKGTVAKDEYIAKLSQPKLDSESITQLIDKQEKSPTIAFPDRAQIYQTVFQQSGLDPQMTQWSWAQWQQYAVDKGIPEVAIVELRQNVRQAQNYAEQQYDVQNLKAINIETIEYEKDQINELVKNAGVEFTQEQLNKIITQAWEARKEGLLVPGLITRLAANEILSAVMNKQKTTAQASAEEIRKKAEAEILAVKQKLNQLPQDGGSRKDFNKSDIKVAPNTRVAAQEALASYIQTHQ